MDKRQKIYDQIKQAENNMAEAVREAKKALALLDELYFDHVVDGELDQTAINADRIKTRLECTVSEKVRFVPMELENVGKDFLERFGRFDGVNMEWKI
jgi:hypothetical protein